MKISRKLKRTLLNRFGDENFDVIEPEEEYRNICHDVTELRKELLKTIEIIQIPSSIHIF